MITAIRLVLAAAGIDLQRPDGQGALKDRFHGHCLRVSGAQMLAAAGVQLQLIQLLGRWTSMSVQRYTQDAALILTPELPEAVLGERPMTTDNSALPSAVTGPQSAPQATPADPVHHSTESHEATIRRLDSLDQRHSQDMAILRGQLASLKESVAKPAHAFVKRIRSCIVHIGSMHELSNPPFQWKSRCGWQYGTANFLRVTDIVRPLRKCRKCFDLGGQSSSEGSSTSSSIVSEDTSSDDA